MKVVTIVDNGAGNLRSMENALYRLGVETTATSDPDVVRHADRLVLPGVGQAASYLEELHERGLAEAVTEAVRLRGRPMLAVCVAMQVLAARCVEGGKRAGLGWYPGTVESLSDRCAEALPVPHVGFAPLHVEGAFPIPNALHRSRVPVMYFNHGYAVATGPAAEDHVAAKVEYGREWAACVSSDSWIAVQFHPEKSHLDGARMLEAFTEWSP